MKTIRVVAAVITAVNDKNEPIIFATERGYGEFKGDGSFPEERLKRGRRPRRPLRGRSGRNWTRRLKSAS